MTTEPKKDQITMKVGVPHDHPDKVALQMTKEGDPVNTLAVVMTLVEAKRFAEVIITKAAEVQAKLDAEKGGERIVQIHEPSIVVPRTR